MIRIAVALSVFMLLGTVEARAQGSVFLEELTWTEVRDEVKAGKTTVLIPTGGTEQNGPHMILGKHNIIVRFTAGEIAKQLGNALVAPVVAYVPEGSIDPPSGHMRFPGTITLPEEHFAKILEFAARSFKAHGFLDIVFIGDSGGNQAGQKTVADRLNKEWASTQVRVHHAEAYYTANGSDDWLVQQGETVASIGNHASIPDTSQLLALYPQGVRRNKLDPGRANDGSGVSGDPTRSSAAYGKKILELKIATGVRVIRELRESSRISR
jgi:creatinine amidohydrolase/Fe(II)-dependent formamide hydrolase-like protein